MLITKLPKGIVEFTRDRGVYQAPALAIIACAVETVSNRLYGGNIIAERLDQVGPTRVRLKLLGDDGDIHQT